MDRHSDRVDHKKAQEAQPPAPGRDRNIREQVHQRTTNMRRSAAKGASSGRAIDAELDQIVSQQAMHTTERTGDRADARVRDDIESYRREMQLAAIAGSRQRQSKETVERAAKTDLNPTRPSAHARAAGQSRPRATARNQPGARPGGPARQHATLRLTAPNFGNMRVGGNRNVIAPVRQQVPLTRSELDRIRGRYKEARTNTPMR